MDLNCSSLLDDLFQGQEELPPNSTLSATDPKPNYLLQDHAYGCVLNKGYEPWVPGREQGVNDSDTEDLLQLLINPNDIYNSRSPTASPESDSGISDDPCADAPLQADPNPPDSSPTVIYEVICDTGLVEDAGLPDHVFSSSLGNWTSPVILPEACVPREVSLRLLENAAQPNMTGLAMDPLEQLHLPPGLYLTDEEKRLLSQEGISLRSNIPLTKAEERILKKVRRKIRNKQSAQDSRRRKKEYIDGLEGRVTACSAQNQELRKKVQQLETHNVSLLDQLQKLQKLIKQTSTKAAQTTICLVILIFSLGLLILPSYSSLLGGTQISRDDYKPSGVISRNILTKGGLSDPEEPPAASADPELPRVRIELTQEGPGTSDEGQGSNGTPGILGKGVMVNTSDPGALRIPPVEPKEGLLAKSTRPEPDKDPAKQMHADEM
ncbi:cyclic AMP-responsive element-binding protein 3-like protein 4 [Elgaria multicarinata webbii]|uniref:cyclic AMP-responsive element-binding protein 3-like protein 4 n=1 Tax=Elgaria multicarinata webbii TaxID=159646 RepID=UPI002FCD2B8D